MPTESVTTGSAAADAVASDAAAAGPVPPAVRAVDLRKTYRGRRQPVEAVRGLDLTVPRGDFFGLLGPNGAGKSTTIGMLTTLVRPTGGRAEVLGHDVTAAPVEVKRRIGVVSQGGTLDRDLTVAENLEFRGRYFGMGARAARRRAGELLERFGLAGRRDAMPHQLSGGQLRRVMICRALVHRPEMLFLDEPTAGLDPQTRLNLWDLLRELHADGHTLLLTTHYLQEAEALCRHLAVIDRGEVLACDTVDGLKAAVEAETVVTVTYDGPVPELSGVRARRGVERVEQAGGSVRVFTRDADGLLGELVALGAAAGATVADASQQRPSLETVFLTLTGREYRE
ncbi:multidrug ABC transporter ATP-binding protein [Actinomadura sp. NBRC 104425]|uniref:ABC transporter ATP-binding protein n=1 Tax=Actinomadura sp. NBRC 104425 TaxID=3032204 RepID=UPI0024A0AECE|nr:ABC transporter ATP-binding protein [Actinomadura sp. NBRC 104425]GLZ12884.1 multidrug ABC transporter ATP-binding protein [Actinomadura sp. NBRC 104425]